jgi:YgiT-type zinc finger domain-containing protein
MECIICKNGQTKEGHDTLTIEMDGHLVIVKDVPGQVCENCGHFYIDAVAAIEVQKKAKRAVAEGAELEILKYA